MLHNLVRLMMRMLDENRKIGIPHKERTIGIKRILRLYDDMLNDSKRIWTQGDEQ